MILIEKYEKEINTIKELIKPAVDRHYPSKANKEVISLHDLITLGILAHLHFNGVIKYMPITTSLKRNYSRKLDTIK